MSPRGRSVRAGGFIDLSFVRQVAGWLLLCGLLGVGCAAIGVPRVAGATPYAVLTGSMSPKYPAGTLLIVRPVSGQDLGIGDVITYQVRSGDPVVITHRIVAVDYGANGELSFRTRGDANSVADPNPVREAQVRGRLWYSLPYVGYLTVWLAGPARAMLTGLAVLALGGYGLFMIGTGLIGAGLVGGRRIRRDRPKPDRAPVGHLDAGR